MAYDGYYLTAVDGDSEAKTALVYLTAGLKAAATDVLLEPSATVIIDNRKAVHGRKPFRARFDGTDRWYKREHVTRDLSRSRR